MYSCCLITQPVDFYWLVECNLFILKYFWEEKTQIICNIEYWKGTTVLSVCGCAKGFSWRDCFVGLLNVRYTLSLAKYSFWLLHERDCVCWSFFGVMVSLTSIHRLTGFSIPPPVTSSGSIFSLRLTSDFAVSAHGFKAFYEGKNIITVFKWHTTTCITWPPSINVECVCRNHFMLYLTELLWCAQLANYFFFWSCFVQ